MTNRKTACHKPLIVGHYDYSGNKSGNKQPFNFQNLVHSIDTECYKGENLRGIFLPDFEIISVLSKRDYWKEKKLEAQIAGIIK